MIRSLLPLLAICVLGLPARAQDTPDFRVKVSIAASTESLRREALAITLRELREFRDVRIVDDDSTIKVSVIAREVFTQGGLPIGYAVSFFSMDGNVTYHNLFTGPELSRHCKDLALELNEYVLEPERKRAAKKKSVKP